MHQLWKVDRVINFEKGEIVRDGFVHFGFHSRSGSQFVLLHRKHYGGFLGANGNLEWTVGERKLVPGVPNINATLSFPMYMDSMPDGSPIISNFGDATIYMLDVQKLEARLLIRGHEIGMKDAGNCVVDEEGHIWVNEVTGCRLREFDSEGNQILAIGDGRPGFQQGSSSFAEASFSWIYDIRRGPDGNIYVLDSRNFSVRMVDLANEVVVTLAGTGKPGYKGDGGDARSATFGGDISAKYDGPISLSLDERGNIFVGDRLNKVVRMIDRQGAIATIAGDQYCAPSIRNTPGETDPMRVALPNISSMDYHAGLLLVPTDMPGGTGDLIVLKRVNPVR